MPIPIRTYELDPAQRIPKYIIIHHTEDLHLNSGDILLDTPAFQSDKIQILNYARNKKSNVPYHFICELIHNDYQIINELPLLNKTNFEDIADMYNEAGIHIGLVGNYDLDIPDNRLYTVLAFRCIIPQMNLFRIPISNVYTHGELSIDGSHSNCPGEMFKLNKLKSFIRSYTRRNFINRK